MCPLFLIPTAIIQVKALLSRVFSGLPFWVIDVTILTPTPLTLSSLGELIIAPKIRSRPLGMVSVASHDLPLVSFLTSSLLYPSQITPGSENTKHTFHPLWPWSYSARNLRKLFFFLHHLIYVYILPDPQVCLSTILGDLLKMFPIWKGAKWFIWFHYLLYYQVFIESYTIK